MTIRISSATERGRTVIQVEGRLTAENLELLEAECRMGVSPLRMVLSGLVSADPDGVKTLRSLQAGGAELYGASPYISQLLREDAS